MYRIGDLRFVRDGHHRVSIAMATGQQTIEGYVTEVITSMQRSEPTYRAGLLTASGLFPGRWHPAPRRPADEGLRTDLPGLGPAAAGLPGQDRIH
jgi:hypothetical protein